jgi:hypothetical protein
MPYLVIGADCQKSGNTAQGTAIWFIQMKASKKEYDANYSWTTHLEYNQLKIQKQFVLS